ncbi:hypothetical protein Q3G72_000650 [Acer saccharum]|nr:hypothetical protein Q3G72_000650 [Acer saccharum]
MGGAPESQVLYAEVLISTVSTSLSIFGSVILGQFGLGLSIIVRFHGFGIIERCFWFDHLWCWKLVEIGIGLEAFDLINLFELNVNFEVCGLRIGIDLSWKLEFANCLSCFEYF